MDVLLDVVKCVLFCAM